MNNSNNYNDNNNNNNNTNNNNKVLTPNIGRRNHKEPLVIGYETLPQVFMD